MKKLKKFLFIVFIFGTYTFSSYGQISQGGIPFTMQKNQFFSATENIPMIQMPEVDVNTLKSQDVIYDTYPDIPWRFGENIDVDIDVKTDGVVDLLPDGSRLFRIAIQSPGALSVNLLFDHFVIPDGATLFIYSKDGSDIHGAFTSYNNQQDLMFATTLIQGEEIILEYHEPVFALFSGILHISRVTHGYRGPFDFMKAFGGSGSCNVNVACPQSAGMEDQIRSVCMLVSGGNGFCTGALINNTAQDGKPYVLSADHCYSTPGSVVYWFNWQSATCSNPSSSPSYNSMSGATQRARNSASDFWLVELNQAIPSNYNVYYSGWNKTTDNNISGKVWGIHHPSGDIKKISWSLLGVSTTTYLDNAVPGNGSHWRITNWSDGTTTEGGSSGSPLFDPNGRIIGQLHGGYASCSSNTSDWYGKLGVSWTGGGTSATRLSNWLDPSGTGAMTLNGYDPNAVSNTLDAQLLNIIVPENTYCSISSVSPQVTIKNNGTQTLTSATVSYMLNGGSPVSISWTGSLTTGQTAVVTFPLISLAAGLSQTFVASVTNPNGGTDQQASNNSVSLIFNVVGGMQLPFTEGFEGTTFAPDCWVNMKTGGSGTGTWNRATAGTYPTCSPYSGSAMARYNSYNYAAGTTGILASRSFDLQGDDDVFSFWMYRDNGYLNNLDRINVYVNTAQNVTGATLLGTIHRSRTQTPVVTTNGWYKYEFQIPTGVIGTRYLILEGVSAYGNNMFVDELQLIRNENCAAPVSLSADNITSTSAELSWTQSGTVVSWDIEIGISGFSPSGTPTASGVTNPYNYSNLMPATDYSFYVRAFCGSGDYSSWSGPYDFATNCSVITAPFIEDFEIFPPQCWGISSATTQNWGITTAASGYGTGTNSAIAQFYSYQDATPFYLFSPEFDAAGLTNPALRFDFAYATYSTEVDQLNIYISSDGGGSFTLLQQMPGGTTGMLNTGGVTTSSFVPTSVQWNTFEIAVPSGTNMIAFEAISAYGNNLFIDNVEIYNEIPLNKTLQLNVFLEGLYLSSGLMYEATGSTGPQFGAGIADKITVELYDAIQPDLMKYQNINVELLTDGSCMVDDIPQSVGDNCYIVIKHRNSIETWSVMPVSFSGNGPFTYDFTISAGQAYGNNLKPVAGGLFAIWGGNANGDGIIDIDDMSLIENASQTPVLTGYFPQDINGDGIVDIDDMTVIENNSLPPSVTVKKP